MTVGAQITDSLQRRGDHKSALACQGSQACPISRVLSPFGPMGSSRISEERGSGGPGSGLTSQAAAEHQALSQVPRTQG